MMNDLRLIHTQGLDEGIRCAMCTNTIKSDKGCDGGCVVDHKMYENVLKVIDEALEAQPRWIPVSERLPKDFEDVLVWYEYFRYGDYNRMFQTYGIGCYLSNMGAWSGDPGTGTKVKVFAWMPLPEPYKKGEK